MDYICSIIDDPEPESSLDVLISVLGDFVRAFAALDSEQQAQLVLELLDDVSSPSLAPPACPHRMQSWKL